MQFILSLLILLCGVLLPRVVHGTPLERGTAITDPYVLRELDSGSFALRRMVEPAKSADGPITNDALFALASLLPVRTAIDSEFERYTDRHKTSLANETIGVGASFDFQLFDHALLYSRDTRFVLAGIVNRMDRAYVSPDSCGEIRLIYRLTRSAAGEGAVSPRLPMTLNIVLKARSGDASAIACSAMAQRWLAAGRSQLSGAELVNWLMSQDGPLQLIRPENIDRIETNLQIAHVPKSATRDFRTDYLLKLFRLDARTGMYEEAPLENQIDREKIFADAGLQREFRTWLLDPKHIGELDRGTILIPEKFLATGAIAATPVGFVASNLLPAFGLVQPDDSGSAVFKQRDVVAALKKAAESGISLQNIRSLAGFERRLNDVTCAGCHQTRGIGGFHFPGVDWMAEKPSNSTVVPGSPHFFGDQIRRRDILAAIRDGAPPDYSRGFSGRPQLRGSTELAGTEYDDGWGAHCYDNRAKAADNDKSFRSWTCAEGLACQPVSAASRMGMCFVKSR